MKVLLTARQPGGGIRTFLRYIYSQKCFSDVSLTLVAPDVGLSGYLDKHIPAHRFETTYIQPSNLTLFRTVREKLAEGDFDLVHSHGFSAGVMTEMARVGCGIPHLMTAHDVFRPEQFPGIKGQAKRHALSLLFRRIDRIHTVTESAGVNFTDFMPWVRPEHIRTILHGIDTAYFRRGQCQDLRSALNIPNERPLVGYFGRFMAQKGFRTLVDAMGLMSASVESTLMPHVITFGWGGFIREDYQYVRECGLSEYFHQLPATDAMPDMLKSVDMVAMPSRWEACGLLAMEALCTGVPIIGTNCVGLRDVLEGTPGRMVPPQASHELAMAIQEFVETPRGIDFEQYQPIACRRFDVGRPAAGLRRLYAEMMGDLGFTAPAEEDQGKHSNA
jgi:glycosyltransferase involved in cell wall biosynthesis